MLGQCRQACPVSICVVLVMATPCKDAEILTACAKNETSGISDSALYLLKLGLWFIASEPFWWMVSIYGVERSEIAGMMCFVPVHHEVMITWLLDMVPPKWLCYTGLEIKWIFSMPLCRVQQKTKRSIWACVCACLAILAAFPVVF